MPLFFVSIYFVLYFLAGPGNAEKAMEEVVTLLAYLINRLDKTHK
jgi:hypothetical protein